MTYKQAVRYITKNFDELLTKQHKGYSSPEMEAVWCAYSDTAGSYEVDEEHIGITRDGSIAWAYASGCSCWDGDFSLKEVKLCHDQNTPEEWEAAIIKFAQTSELQSL